MLELKKLTVSYGPIRALEEIDLTARSGRITAVLGANGAGKSSLLKVVSGIVTAASGEVLIEGKDVTAVPAHVRARNGVSLAMEGRRLFRDMSVAENLLLAWSFGPRRTPYEAALERIHEAFPVLQERQGAKAGMLSGGQQQMLILSCVAIREPDYMLLDEPSLGLAPIIVMQIFEFITEYSRTRNTTVLLAEQMAAMALQVADYGYVLRGGRVIMEGDSQELARADIVSQLSSAYL